MKSHRGGWFKGYFIIFIFLSRAVQFPLCRFIAAHEWFVMSVYKISIAHRKLKDNKERCIFDASKQLN